MLIVTSTPGHSPAALTQGLHLASETASIQSNKQHLYVVLTIIIVSTDYEMKFYHKSPTHFGTSGMVWKGFILMLQWHCVKEDK